MTTRIAPAPGQQAPPAQNDVRTGRACDYCRTLKVRCIMENSSADKCQRCAKSNRACVLTAPQKRKQRKRTDTRVAELEREVRAMQAAISRRNDGTGQEGIKTADQVCHAFASHSSALKMSRRRTGILPSKPIRHFLMRRVTNYGALSE